MRTQSVFSGLLLNETDIQGVTVKYTYDKTGRLLTRTTAPDTKYENTSTWDYAIQADGPVTIETDVSGNQLKTRFDGAGRNISLHRFDKDNTQQWFEVSSLTYDALGYVDSGTGSDWLTGSSKQYHVNMAASHDGWGAMRTQAFSDGTENRQETDPVALTRAIYMLGNASSQKVSSGKFTTAFDEYSQLPLADTKTDVSGKIQGVRKYQWDGLGRLRREIDEQGNETQRTYDPYGRVLTQTLPDGSVVTRNYAPHLTGEQIVCITVTGQDADGNKRTWQLGTQEFDGLGRVKKRDSGGRTTLYTYKGPSPVPSEVIQPSGKILRYTYIPELDNAVSSMTSDDVIQMFTYDDNTAELLTAKEGSTVNGNTWNTSGSLKAESFSRDGTIRTVAYTRTLAGEVATYTDITGKQIKYDRDEFGRVTTITDEILVASLHYDALGRLSQQTVTDSTTQSTLITALAYDDFGREISRTITDSSGVTLSSSLVWQQNGLLAGRSMQQSNTTVRNEKYNYDARNRLIDYEVTGSILPQDVYGHEMTAQAYRYDALNNLTTVTTTLTDGSSDTAKYHYENGDDPTQLTLVTHTHSDYPQFIRLEYDADGRMTRDEASRTLDYDSIGRLTSVSGGSYGYDALNRLVSQNVSSTDSRELYYRGTELVNEVLKQQNKETRLIKAGHTCLGVNDGSRLTLTAGDYNDSLLWSRDSSQGEGKQHAWSPYGSGETTDLLPGFNGERADPVSGTYHLGNGYRAYNPVLMRFNCPDSLSPFGAGGINPYAYCAGDPVNHTDPSGHISWQGIVGIVTGAIGLGLSIFTAGASIAAAGGVMAALSAASATSLVVGSLGVVADVTAIVSGAVEDVNPQASSVLGWVSLGTGLAGLTSAIGQAPKVLRTRAATRMAPTESSLGERIARIRSHGLSGDGKSFHGLTVYRADMRTPSAIREAGGFHPRSNKSNQEILSAYGERLAKQPDALAREHIVSPNRDFVSTAMDIECGGYVRPDGYIYEIHIPDLKVHGFGPETFGEGAKRLRKGKLFPEFMMNSISLETSTMLAIRQPAQSASREVTFLGAIPINYIKRWQKGSGGEWTSF
ncbi:RHS repeat-associated core domain-containing protein [Xenorhabdus sp. Flor]|uniref:RHS repeat-associated core domain-containing protein n=1 Tax=Xenorhabdus cabanillasii TaxID=351673 RepID=UPI0019A7E6E1|nr:RHS repeat-associated core domain-containing protein [Xenorhabdus sp. Flor]MBD2816236.1 RHS repeat-associated core domain-containing protein [Xenorhabdus sp. Flor]